MTRRRPRPFPREGLPLPRWIPALAIGSLVGFLPWIIYLGFTLPERVSAQHYDIAWLGFDCAMWSVLAVLAFCAIRRHVATGPVAAVASTMLIVDAWFDVFTSSAGQGEMVLAVVLALCGELPLAILCGWAAVHAERIRARSYRSLHLRWERAVRAGVRARMVSVRPVARQP